ncbi:MAG: tetratricopeptide repeat protein [Calditrichaeota bacterium]|nr:MAG: tetratricopeptide repeat protein [Calditrichota bacterium]MBL1204427.1 tetratricopeptide repeat protein [Calditrichota bacterium]NOG44256.1 tetratricopeptide repeat protein [Calditrichota bacterium]
MFKKMILLAFITLLSSGIVFAQNEDVRSQAAGQAYNSGMDLSRQKKFDKAIPKFLEAIKEDSNFPKANYMLAYAYQKTTKYSEAENAYKNAIKLDSKFEKAYISLAKLQSKIDKTSEAINTYKAVLAFNPTSSKANFGLGKIYYQQKVWEKALKFSNASIESNGKYAPAHNILGLTYAGLKRHSKAAEAFENAIANTSAKQKQLKGTYYYRLGEAYVNAKNYTKAEDALKKAISSTRRSNVKAACNFNLGIVYKNKGQSQKALKHFREAAKNRSWKQSAEYEIDIILNPDKYSY